MTALKAIEWLRLRQHILIVLLAFFMFESNLSKAQEQQLPSLKWIQGTLEYQADSLGNRIPDYSWCGYQSSNVDIPTVPVKVVVPPLSGDATADLQKAIDYVSELPAGQNGFRGAILLQEGIYHVSGRFALKTSGIVLRGCGNKTVLRATGTDRATLLRVHGNNDIQLKNKTRVATDYLPVGSTEIPVENISVFKTGMQIRINRPCTPEWIDFLGMKEYGGETGWLGWKPGQREINWERTVLAIRGNKLVVDAPLTTAIDSKFGGGTVSEINWPGRISKIGIENLVLESEFDSSNLKDENHCWFAITLENIQDAWVRQVTFRHFAGSAVAVYETASRVTVEDCTSLDPVSEIAGWRRNTFFTMGQQSLFLRCYAENGNHDFATGFMAAGPNAFVQCENRNPNNFSGAVDSWASGTLFDIVSIDGQKLSFANRGQDNHGAGWTAAGSMFWQCSAARMECFAPPGAMNWAYGAWSQFAGNGIWVDANNHINPRSLFFAQLANRLGKGMEQFAGEILPFEGESTSSPTVEQAAKLIAASAKPPIQLQDYIEQAGSRNPISTDYEGAVSVSEIKTEERTSPFTENKFVMQNGWLTCNNKALIGRRFEEPWWRGDPRPYEAVKAGPAITRFVPGRDGNGYTDNLSEVVELMNEHGVVAVEHNYGLWYDRRRDDHERVKRLDPEVWAPFYEQPFARSGQGEAWDRLSRYDLTKPNPWYWGRLHEFARLAGEQGKLLIHQNYFQHNILEAGAHWADSPWRPANNINQTGFPEPPPYAGDKRIYLAEQFYDLTNPIRRELHRQFIRQCMENFRGQSNVIQCISAEYTGPLHFVEFWLDVIAQWEKETGEHPLIALSTTKDVQDAILADPVRSQIIDIIDIRYWAYRDDGTTYAPAGGVNLAPRQHARQMKVGKRSFESVYRAVSDYRTKFPDKAVIYSEGNYSGFGWAIFMAGGSLAVLPQTTDTAFLKAAASMHPFETGQAKIVGLRDSGNGMILYNAENDNIVVDLTNYTGNYLIRFIHPNTGSLLDQKQQLEGGKAALLQLPDKNLIIWIQKI